MHIALAEGARVCRAARLVSSFARPRWLIAAACVVMAATWGGCGAGSDTIGGTTLLPDDNAGDATNSIDEEGGSDITLLTLLDPSDSGDDGPFDGDRDPKDEGTGDGASVGDDALTGTTTTHDTSASDGTTTDGTGLIGPNAGQPTEEEILAVLATLPPLPKPHYAPTVLGLLPEWQDFNREIVRINRTSFIHGGANEYATRQAIRVAIGANEAEPEAPSVVLNMYWTPWSLEYSEQPHPVTDFGPLYVQGLTRMREFFSNQRTWIDRANQDFGSNIQVGHITLEIELWPLRTAENEADWEIALLRRHNECYDLTKSIFPNATITWFDRGGVHHGAMFGLPTYGENRRFTYKEKGDNCSNFFYTLAMGRVVAVEEMRRSIENINEHYGPDVPIISFVALAGGGALTMNKPLQLETSRFRDYELIHSFHIGMFINRPEYGTNAGHIMLGADWSRVPGVFFYPNLLDHKLTREQVMVRLKHYVAYVCGATDTPFPTTWPSK